MTRFYKVGGRYVTVNLFLGLAFGITWAYGRLFVNIGPLQIYGPS